MLATSLIRDLFATLRTVARQALLSKGFSRHEYWSALPFLPPGGLPRDQTRVSYVSCVGRWVLYHQRHQEKQVLQNAPSGGGGTDQGSKGGPSAVLGQPKSEETDLPRTNRFLLVRTEIPERTLMTNRDLFSLFHICFKIRKKWPHRME